MTSFLSLAAHRWATVAESVVWIMKCTNQGKKAIATASASVEAGGIAHTSALDNDGAEVLWG